MSHQINGFKVGTLLAGEDLSAKQFYFVKIDSNGAVALCGNGEAGMGVLENAPESGYAAEVLVNGIARVYAGAAVTKGYQVAADATGRAVRATTGEYILGTAIEAASDAGEMITILLEKQGISD